MELSENLEMMKQLLLFGSSQGEIEKVTSPKRSRIILRSFETIQILNFTIKMTFQTP